MTKFESEKKISYDVLMEHYHALNRIKPFFYQTKYPFNTLTPDKIIFTENKIDILEHDY